MVFGGDPMHNDDILYTNRFPENTNLIYIAAHAEADYIDPQTRHLSVVQAVYCNRQLI